MSGRGQVNRNRPRKTASHRAGLQFPVGRIHRYLKASLFKQRLSFQSSVYLAAVLEYLCAEILELSGNLVLESKKVRITPRHILLAVRHDTELSQMLEDVTIPEGGVVPHIQPVLLPKKQSAFKEK
ncbi:histone H2A, sperm-like [Homarus americanus]|uniref:histone H2A, sperm-like n=1 Tax=Homarus americanus TaxID=6706 RepID=UPI001C466684|nr:histone H2A, sperm-like [Homarus americanus]XP_042243217.1 histone H2A, sperm-like [Homarus americanus]